MRIEGDTICFKSEPDAFFTELYEGKCWTLRHLTTEEDVAVRDAWRCGRLSRIRITNTITGESFERELAHRPFSCGCVLGLNLVGFGWREQG